MAIRKVDRVRAHQLLVDSERLERELLVLIGRLTAFTDELQGQLQVRRDEEGGGDYGPAADGSVVR